MGFRGPFRRMEDRLSRGAPVEPGLYHYQEGDRYGATRFHLRIEPDGRGILSIDARRILHLNQTAAEYAKLVLEGADAEAAVRRLRSVYRVKPDRVRADFEDLKEKITALGSSDGVCPVSYLDVERIEPFRTPTTAPYRMDFALTYRCDNDCPHCYVERLPGFPEMETGEWKRALERLWELGIPHVVFTGGEATLREDLVELVEHAEDLGLITGLLTNGRRLGGGDLMERLAEAGLDHVQVTIESHLPGVHERMTGCPGSWAETVRGIKRALSSPVYTITNSTITSDNRDTVVETVDFLAGLGLRTIAMNGIIYTGGARGTGAGVPEEEMAGILCEVRDRAHRNGLDLIWYTPTRYCRLDPVGLGLGPKQCTAAKYNMCVEPNGDVIPCQSYFETAGNLLTDDWPDIWKSPVCERVRERAFAGPGCRECESFQICGAGCPLAGEEGTLLCFESRSSG
ncbi:MAG: radical SAM protein [Gemmatimonadetes bacterium]|nr:radical SAM protein [Gemmatimonadota bacterium]